MALSLWQRLLLITLAGIIPMLAVLAYNEVSVRTARYAELHDLAGSTAQQASLEIERLMVGTENVLKAVSAAPAVKAFDAIRCGPYLADLKMNIPELSVIVVYDTHGDSQCRSDDLPLGGNFSDRTYFQEALAKPGQLIVGEFTIGRVTGKPGLPLALSIAGENGRPTMVVAAGLDLTWFGRSLKERQLAKDASLTIADRQGVIIAREPLPERFLGTKIPDGYLPLVNADHPGTQEVVSQDGTRRILGYIPAPVSPSQGLYMSVGISVDEAFRTINSGTVRAILIALIASAASLSFAFWLSRSMVQGPVRRIQRVLTARRRGRDTVRTGMSAKMGELEALGTEFDAFMDELSTAKAERERAEERRQLMTHELSHRLKNIIATIQSVAMQSLRRHAEPEALNAFILRLGSIAQAHHLLLNDEVSGATVHSVILAAIRPFTELDANRVGIEGPDLLLRPSAVQSLSMALHELCTNASKYGALSTEEGRISIAWDLTDDHFHFEWLEIGGPPVEAPARSGFGSTMIERVLAMELSASVSLRFEQPGLIFRLEAPQSSVLKGDGVEL